MTDLTSSTPPLSFADIARRPLPGMTTPVGFGFGPGDSVVTWLHAEEGSLDRRLYVLDLTTTGAAPQPVDLGGAAEVTRELTVDEQLRRERARDLGQGVSSATWAAVADALLVATPGGLVVVTGLAVDPSAPDVQLLDVPVEAIGAQLSPNGRQLAYVVDGDLYVTSVTGQRPPVRLTDSAEDGVTNGLAEYIAQEEMSRSQGFWWSPDSRAIAYTEVDERHIPIYRIVHQGSDEVGPGAQEDHRYPFAGAANAIVRLGVVQVPDTDTGNGPPDSTAAADVPPTRWMDAGEPGSYLGRVHWLADGRLFAEIEPRDQSRIDLIELDTATGGATLRHQEVGDPYVNLTDDFHELKDGRWIWSSERTGFRHLEVHTANDTGGVEITTLTSGEWQLDHVEGVDEANGIVYFTATKDGPTERHLYAVPLQGGEITRCTSAAGMHSVRLGRGSAVMVDHHSSRSEPPTVVLRSLAAPSTTPLPPLAVVHDRRDPRIDELGLGASDVEIVSFAAADGETTLYALLYRPGPAAAPPPLVVQVYGGPHYQGVIDDWSTVANLRCEQLRRLGFTVLMVDNRGSARRGVAFERPLWHRMGTIEVEDQVAGVRWAVEQGLADPARVGIFGWSYGGYMVLRCLAEAPDVFHVGVAGAPVTDWDGYDTYYTERYMGTPQGNPDGYAVSSVFAGVERIRGDLMLVHGLIDENVHFRHTARLVNRLISHRIPHRLLCFPDERHMPRHERDRAWMEEEVIGWLSSKLSQPASPDPG